MKYFAQTLFDAVSLGTANTSGISSQFDVGEMATLWLQASATGQNSTTDYSIQLQCSNDPMEKAATSSIWIDEGSVASYLTSNLFDKHINICAQKARVSVTRNSGAAVLTIRNVGKPTTTVGTGVTTGTNTGDVTLAAFGSTPSANAASLSGQVLTLQPASATLPGGMSTAGQSIGGIKTFSSGLIGKGTTANDSASAGYIGEFIQISTLQSAALSITTGSSNDIVSGGLTLSAGDWDLEGYLDFLPGATTVITHIFGAISKTSATLPAGDTSAVPTSGEVYVNQSYPAGSIPASIVGVALPRTRASINSATTFYPVGRANFSASTLSVYGHLSARRAR